MAAVALAPGLCAVRGSILRREQEPKKSKQTMKIALIGFGGVGQEVVRNLVEYCSITSSVAEICVISRNVKKSRAICNDIIDGVLTKYIYGAREKISLPKLTCSDDYANVAGGDILICCYGVASKFPMNDRQELLEDHLRLTDEVVAKLLPHIKSELLLISTVNPVDTVCGYMARITNLPLRQIVGVAGSHSTARLLATIHEETGIGYDAIHKSSLVTCGEHGNGLVPVASRIAVGNQLLQALVTSTTIERIINGTKRRGLSIFHDMMAPPKFGPAASVQMLMERILSGDESPFCASVWTLVVELRAKRAKHEEILNASVDTAIAELGLSDQYDRLTRSFAEVSSAVIRLKSRIEVKVREFPKSVRSRLLTDGFDEDFVRDNCPVEKLHRYLEHRINDVLELKDPKLDAQREKLSLFCEAVVEGCSGDATYKSVVAALNTFVWLNGKREQASLPLYIERLKEVAPDYFDVSDREDSVDLLARWAADLHFNELDGRYLPPLCATTTCIPAPTSKVFFSDCGESSLRNFINVLVKNQRTGELDVKILATTDLVVDI